MLREELQELREVDQLEPDTGALGTKYNTWLEKGSIIHIVNDASINIPTHVIAKESGIDVRNFNKWMSGYYQFLDSNDTHGLLIFLKSQCGLVYSGELRDYPNIVNVDYREQDEDIAVERAEKIASRKQKLNQNKQEIESIDVTAKTPKKRIVKSNLNNSKTIERICPVTGAVVVYNSITDAYEENKGVLNRTKEEFRKILKNGTDEVVEMSGYMWRVLK